MSDKDAEIRRALCESAQAYARGKLDKNQTLIAQGTNEFAGEVFTLYRCGCPECNGQVFMSVMDIPNRQECVIRVTKKFKDAISQLDN